uniref:Uncharacterized protein n=1 Tax=Anguilla anguilla TaxID=7936 RepID=A0A0E9RSV1_ANGAN
MRFKKPLKIGTCMNTHMHYRDLKYACSPQRGSSECFGAPRVILRVMCNPGEAFGSTYKAFLNLCEESLF